MKKKLIIGIVVACLVVAGIVTAVVIKNNKAKPEEDVQTSNELEKAGNEDLANDDSMNKFGEAEDETFVVAEDGSVLSTVDDKYYTFEQVNEPSDMFPNGQDDYEVQKWEEYQKYWDDFSVYGTFGPTDAPPCGETGYNEDYLVEKTTDKGAVCIVDTRTGKIYYNMMILPTGIAYAADVETYNMGVYYIADHEDQCPNGLYSFTYEMMQDCYGVPVN